MYVSYHKTSLYDTSLVPRPLPDFISQPWRKIGRRPGIKSTSRTGYGGLGQYVTWTRFVLSPPFPVRDVVLIPGLLPIFLHGCEIKSGSGLGTRLVLYMLFGILQDNIPGFAKSTDIIGLVTGREGRTFSLEGCGRDRKAKQPGVDL